MIDSGDSATTSASGMSSVSTDFLDSLAGAVLAGLPVDAFTHEFDVEGLGVLVVGRIEPDIGDGSIHR